MHLLCLRWNAKCYGTKMCKTIPNLKGVLSNNEKKSKCIIKMKWYIREHGNQNHNEIALYIH